MRRHIGFLMQLFVLALLPMIILWQLNFGIPLVVMPVTMLIGVMIFSVGHKLREG